MHLQGLKPLFQLRHTSPISQSLFGSSSRLLSATKGPVTTTSKSQHLRFTTSEALLPCARALINSRQRPSRLRESLVHGCRSVHATSRGDETRAAGRTDSISLTTENTTSEKLLPRTGSNLNFFTALPKEQARRVTQYVDALLEWNQRFNLTAITERAAVMERHIEDSLALLPHIERSAIQTETLSGKLNLRVVDVGSGAGLPGMILAIARPEWEVTLVESLRKRCDFLRHVVKLAGLTNTTVIWARAEDAGRDASLREAHDVAVARAVADMRTLSELCLPLVAVGGLFLAPKGAAPEAEVAAAEKAVETLGARLLSVQSVASEGPQGLRSVVIYVKDTATPSKYPRRAGLPAKRPL